MHFRKYQLRFYIIQYGMLMALGVFVFKLITIQVFNAEHLKELAQRQHNHSVEIEPIRGTIYDRNMRPLAMNVTVKSLYANPRIMAFSDRKQAAHELSQILDVSYDAMMQRFNKKKHFVWLKRKLSASHAEKIQNLNIKGLGFVNETKRYYPNRHLAAHMLGFAGIDNKGLEGLELYYNSYLQGRAGRSQLLRDALQRDLMVTEDYMAPQDGAHLILTLDESIQFIAEQALDKAYAEHQAKGATIIVQDVRNGDILALANRPTYDLESFGESSTASRTNRAVSFVYEPGSVFKVVTLAAALESGQLHEDDTIFCENGSYRIANHTLTDHRPHGLLTVADVIKVSSNIGVVKMAEKMGSGLIYDYGKRFRFGQKTNISLYGEVDGWLKKTTQWSKTTIGAIPIGYEITVTPLQLISAISAIANNGLYMKPRLVKQIIDPHDYVLQSFPPTVQSQVIAANTAKRMTKILERVVEDGTARRAQIKGIRVAGKTGTARKVEDGQYVKGKYYSTFMGFAPADNPILAAIVILDEPGPKYFGGTVAAPVFREVIESSLRYLELMGDGSSQISRLPLEK